MSGWILGAAEAASSLHSGGKARALARAQRAGLPVPDWFVLSAAAFAGSLTPEQRALLKQASDADVVQRIVGEVRIAGSVELALARAVNDLCPDGELLAVRSSASDEDGTQHSFAGQLESFLNVPPADVLDRVRAVWRSAFTPRILMYRRQHGLPPAPRPPAVLVQRMVQPRAAGVAFSADPVSGRRGVVVVSAVHGLGSAVVSGEADADTWQVDRGGTIVERRIVPKHRMHVPDGDAPEGVRTVDVDRELAGKAALTDEEVRAVAELTRAAARHFGLPQDIEWAIADRLATPTRLPRRGPRLVLLQSRPITSLRALADPDARLVIWDNSNIVESYSGVTSPLTFSFAREIYQYVYQQFCRMMAVPEHVIAEHDETFRNMLGLVRGRLYYNLLNWYRMLALLPGYHVNRRFMEQMMGVREPLPEALAEDVARTARRGRALDGLYLARTVMGLLVNHATINRRVDAFYKRLDEALTPPSPPLEDRRPDELVAHYRDLRGRLLLNWDAPLVNDFFAMIFYGLLRRLVTRWCGDPAGTLQNDLIGGEGGMVSAEPAVRMRTLAHIAAADPQLLDRLKTGTLDQILEGLDEQRPFAEEYRRYLAKFGDRTVNELKLESSTLHDDPLPLFRAVGDLAHQIAGAAGAEPAVARPSSGDRLRMEARRRVADALARRPFRRIAFQWVLRHARRRVRDRENLRLERTRLFGRVRRIFLELGRRLHAMDLLDDSRDVLYLEVDEVLAFVDGRSTCTDLRSLATLRKREFQGYEAGPPPDDRFETRGPVYQGHDFRRAQTVPDEAGEERRGLGCSPGVVRGPVRIVTDPRTADLANRAILVAEHTDPGWIMVFPSALGVLVERGSLLSHAAIVARELGIPAVVSVPGVTRWLQNDDWIELDGSTGLIRRVPPSA
jgi:phosphohistidine swiveling domain-containing protein